MSLPGTETAGDLDRACSSANFGSTVGVTGGFGVCTYIKRAWLRCAATSQKHGGSRVRFEELTGAWSKKGLEGWRHIFAPDVFVAWNGPSRSFDEHERVASQGNAEDILPYRAAFTAARYRLDKYPVMLFITHTLSLIHI